MGLSISMNSREMWSSSLSLNERTDTKDFRAVMSGGDQIQPILFKVNGRVFLDFSGRTRPRPGRTPPPSDACEPGQTATFEDDVRAVKNFRYPWGTLCPGGK